MGQNFAFGNILSTLLADLFMYNVPNLICVQSHDTILKIVNFDIKLSSDLNVSMFYWSTLYTVLRLHHHYHLFIIIIITKHIFHYDIRLINYCIRNGTERGLNRILICRLLMHSRVHFEIYNKASRKRIYTMQLFTFYPFQKYSRKTWPYILLLFHKKVPTAYYKPGTKLSNLRQAWFYVTKLKHIPIVNEHKVS